jgi:hypothetical protein
VILPHQSGETGTITDHGDGRFEPQSQPKVTFCEVPEAWSRMVVFKPQKGKGWRVIPEDADFRLLLAVGFSTLFGVTIVASRW